MTDISFITDTISIYRKNRYYKRRYDTNKNNNIDIADIIDDTDTIDPSLLDMCIYINNNNNIIIAPNLI